MEDPFKVLGVPETATLDEIKKAYRKLAVQHHPDKTGGDDTEFKRITAAYELIGDAQALKRWNSRGTLNFDEDHNTYFNDFFAAHFAQQHVKRAVHAILPIDLEEVFRGGPKAFHYENSESCPSCGGLGGTSFETCRACQGKGAELLGGFSLVRCRGCNGTGKSIKIVCSGCAGKGSRVEVLKTEVIIPQGAMDGTQAPSTDKKVIVTFRINKHPLFERKNFDIHSQIGLPLEQVFNGHSVTVKTLHGDVEVTIPRCVQPNQMLRVKEKGLFDFRRGIFGDHILKLNVTIPHLTEEQCEKLTTCLHEIQKTTISET